MDLATDDVLQMKNVRKEFPGVVALDNVSFEVRRGEVHGLMGENGAGKSTLMKVLAGIYQPDSGDILLRGEKVRFQSPRDSLQKGIAMIHQELNSVLDMTVAENIFLGRELTVPGTGIVKRRLLKEMTREILQQIRSDIDPNRKLRSLSVAEMQMVEIAKALSYQSDIIIMDEPTSAITDREVNILFGVIEELKASGKAIIYISHKMDELFRLTDRITVLRDGQYIATRDTSELTQRDLIQMMVGRDLTQIYPKEDIEIRDVLLEVKNLSRHNEFRNINLQVRGGEIVGIAGLMGAGRTELVESIFGARRADTGEIRVKGKPVTIRNPKDGIRNGIALVTEDRKLLGLNLKASVKDNIVIANLSAYTYLRQIINFKAEKAAADEKIEQMNVKTPSRNTIVGTLSGGNQQKVVLSNWMLTNPDVLILDEPTRGIDIGAKSEIYKMISRIAKEGRGIIMISSEMPELFGMCDRILVLYQGEITGEFSRAEFDQNQVMACASGFRKGEAVI
ncbi:sugar ABC transporter ATP-binding protein [Cohnella thermotolerans]|uniref:sugar ABC transporter ATP-binding protein n=1 Tax=Cohnella thermotolerans TaxID=329858 RepID=UPI000418CEF7|nr:sugar ABC transporter ATP-binding protein [Cohnella thermotolerans]